MNFRTFIILSFSVAGKGQILLDAQCDIGVTAGTQVKVTLTRHESAAVGAGTGDSHVILILILSRAKSRGRGGKQVQHGCRKYQQCQGKQEFFESKSSYICNLRCIHLDSHRKI